MSVFEAVERDLEQLGGGLKHSALAAQALELAAGMDNPKNSLTSKSMCAKALMETMERLRELAPPRKENDGVDDLEAAREKRRAAIRSAAAPD